MTFGMLTVFVLRLAAVPAVTEAAAPVVGLPTGCVWPVALLPLRAVLMSVIKWLRPLLSRYFAI